MLRDVFISNGYPVKLVKEMLDKSWEVETLKALLVGVKQDVKPVNQKEFYDVLNAPYVKGFCEGLQRKLRKFNIGYVPKKGETLYTHLCKLKQRVELEDRKNMIYAVECKTCGIQYVGETGQHYCDRRKQHQVDVKNKKTTNSISEHLRHNLDHEINWEKVVFWIRRTTGKGESSKRPCTSML